MSQYLSKKYIYLSYLQFLTCQHLLDSEKLDCYRLRLARLNEEMREDNEIA